MEDGLLMNEFRYYRGRLQRWGVVPHEVEPISGKTSNMPNIHDWHDYTGPIPTGAK